MGTMAAQPFKVCRIGGGKTARTFFMRSSPGIKRRHGTSSPQSMEFRLNRPELSAFAERTFAALGGYEIANSRC
jgi:hypothetical protein